MTEPLAAMLAGWAAGLSFADLPKAVVADARLRILDTLGIILAAKHSATAQAALRAGRALGGGDQAGIVGHRERTTASLAALVNGTAAHAFDFDDTHNASVMHPSVVSVPAALAMVQAVGGGGADLILGVAIGNEIGCRLGLVAPGAFHDAGLHPTSVLGTPAAALIAGRLLGLSAAQMTSAVGISASQGSGVLEAYADGTWSKTLHPGWAGHAGIVAALLAREGFTGPASGLDGAYGLFRSHVQRPDYSFDFAAATEGLGRRWHMLDTAFKLYPCAHSIHAFVEGAIELRAAHGLTAEAIAKVELAIPAGFIGQIAEPRAAKLAPRTPTHARASVLYAVAAALAQGSLGMADYTEAAIKRRAIRALSRRITHTAQAIDGPIRFGGALRITCTDGRVLSLAIDEADGTGARRLSRTRLEAKFRACAEGVLPPARLAATIAMLRRVADLPNVDALLEALA